MPISLLAILPDPPSAYRYGVSIGVSRLRYNEGRPGYGIEEGVEGRAVCTLSRHGKTQDPTVGAPDVFHNARRKNHLLIPSGTQVALAYFRRC